MPSANSELAELSPVGSSVLNSIGVISYTGTQIATLASSSPVNGRIVYCNTTGSIYTQGHWYGWDGVLGKFIDLLAFPDHFLFNAQNFKYATIDRRTFTKEMWHYESSGTGAAVNFVDDGTDMFMELVTGTTTTGWASIKLGSPTLDFAKPMLFMVKYKTPSVVTGQIFKAGLCMDRAGGAPTTNRKFGIEYCDADTDWQIHSGDGTDDTNADTADSVEVSNINSWYVSHDPGNKVTAIRKDGTTYEKNTDVPNGVAANTNRSVSLSFSNNNGSATSRTMTIYAVYAVVAYNDTNWTIG